MSFVKTKVFRVIFLFLALLLASFSVKAAAPNLSGRILLQVEKGGQAWYIDPVTYRRAFLGRPEDAFKVMRGFGLGVSNSDLSKIRQSTARRQKLSGRILLQVENNGAAFYINPADLTLNYLGRPADAFNVMRTLALGISNKNLALIPLDPRYPDTIKSNTSTASSTATSTAIKVSNSQIIAANPCKSWTYSPWSACSVWGNQTRTIAQTFPDGCFMPYNSENNYILAQSCVSVFASSTTASTTGSIITPIATSTADLSPDDRFLSAAFADYGKTFTGWAGQCKTWVSQVASTTFGAILPLNNSNNYTWNLNPCAANNFQVLYRSVAIEKADRGDIVQFNIASLKNLPHTALIVSKTPTGMIWIHSNWSKALTVSVNFITYQYFNAIAGSQYSVYHIY